MAACWDVRSGMFACRELQTTQSASQNWVVQIDECKIWAHFAMRAKSFDPPLASWRCRPRNSCAMQHQEVKIAIPGRPP
eukprot:4803780-Amphidinium_carterae.1